MADLRKFSGRLMETVWTSVSFICPYVEVSSTTLIKLTRDFSTMASVPSVAFSRVSNGFLPQIWASIRTKNAQLMTKENNVRSTPMWNYSSDRGKERETNR